MLCGGMEFLARFAIFALRAHAAQICHFCFGLEADSCNITSPIHRPIPVIDHNIRSLSRVE